jgi:Flp pilus assembly protein TadD
MKAIAAIACVVVLSHATAQRPAPDIDAGLRTYASGDHSAAVASVTSGRVTVAALTGTLDRWIAAAPVENRPQRALVASAFALEAVWAVTRAWSSSRLSANLDPWGRSTPSEPERVGISSGLAPGYIGAWIMQQAVPRPSDASRHLHLAAIGVMEDGHSWHQLQETLSAFRSALPDDPRVRLAAVLSDTNRALGTLRVSAATRIDVMRDEDLGSSVTRRIPAAQRAFDALASDPALGGEAQLRAAFLSLRLRNWKDAIARLERAREAQTEPVLKAAVDYFLGWTYARTKNDDAAIAAYRRALALTPAMRNLATELSALLYLRNEREEAYAILDRAFNDNAIPQDFMLIIERADARFVDGHLRAVRGGLR